MKPARPSCLGLILRHPWRFSRQVIRAFKRNQGLLLSGAVAYYMLLSIIPLMMLLLVGLSQFVPQKQLLATVRYDLNLVMPTVADLVTEHLVEFLDNRHLIGWLGFFVLLFFATTTFTVLENALSVIFFHRVAIHRRHPLISALIPFLFIALIGLGLLLITLANGALQTLDEESIQLFGRVWHLQGISASSLYLFSFGGLVILMTGFYLIMPPGRLSFSYALIGGTVAAILWEGSRHLLVWYLTTLSLVNLVYGSFANAVILLLSFEIAAFILLFGAQIIAEFERCDFREEPPAFHT